MKKPPVAFYFDYLSPWAYFAWLELQKLIASHGIAPELHPVPYPKLSELWKQRAIATLPPKRQFIYKFATRYAKKRGIPFASPKFHPYKPYPSLRASLASVAGKDQPKVIDALFRACWVEGVDMGSETELAKFLTAQGLPGEALLAKAASAGAKQALSDDTTAAVARGVFGVPTILVDKELFWGVDQFEYVRDYLEGEDPAGDMELMPSSWGLDGVPADPAKITGVAHTILSVSDFARSQPFYEKLLSYLGLTRVFGGESTLYFVGGKTAIGVGQCPQKFKGQKFEQGQIGLHHLCLRARSREHIDELHAQLKAMGAKIVHPPEEGPWAPGYYSVLFEDPDGIRLEVNHVPGQGLLRPGAKFNPAGHYH